MLKNLEQYVQVLKIEKNHSSNTIDSYLSDIKSFEKYLVKRKISFKQIVNETEIIQKYFKYLNRSKISPRSIKRKYSSLSSYFSYLIDRKIIKKNPLNGIYTPKLSKKLPTVLSIEEIKRIFKQSENTDNELLGLRDRCVIELLYSCGLRVSELCELKINNIQFDANVIRFFGKGNKERINKATKLILKSKNPTIIVGAGIKYNSKYREVIKLAELLNVPIVTAAGHGDAIPFNHKLNAGQMGPRGNPVASRLVKEADVILAIGTRLGFNSTFYSYENINKKAKIIQIELEKKISNYKTQEEISNKKIYDISEVENKNKFFQEENLRIGSDLLEIKKKHDILKKEIEKYENQKSNLISKINSVNEALSDTNILTNVFENKVENKVKVIDHSKIEKKNSSDLNEQIKNIFSDKS